MRKKISALALVMSATLLAQAHAQQWVSVAPPEGRFSVLMPTKPEETTETKDSPLGKYTSHLFLSKAHGVVYIVGWVDYAPGVKLDVQGEINANRDNFLKGVEAKSTFERKISLDGHPGIEFTADSEGHTFKSRIYLVNSRPYMLATAWLKGEPEPAGVSTFLNSFELKGAGQSN
jgi:hypothetical protein